MKYIYFQWIRLLKNKIAAELRYTLITNTRKVISRTIVNIQSVIPPTQYIEELKSALKR